MAIVTVSAEEIRAAVSMRDAIDAVADALLDVSEDKFEQPLRTAMKDGAFLVMPIHHFPSATAMVKTLSLSFTRVPAIAGTVTWVDVDSDDSIIADAGTITALRTGAIAGLATRLLAPASAHRMAMIGAGGQAADQVRAVQTVRPLTRLQIYDVNPAKCAALAQKMTAELPHTDVAICDNVETTVRDVDIVSCATTSREPLFDADMLPSEVHINAIGAFRPTMREIPDDVLAHAQVYVENADAVLEESGEILHAMRHGQLAEADLTELHHVIRGGLGTRPPWTVFKTVGIAAQDWAVARLLAQSLRSHR